MTDNGSATRRAFSIEKLDKVTSARKKGDLVPPGKYLVLAILDYGGETLAGGQFVLRIKPLQLVPIGNAKAPPQI